MTEHFTSEEAVALASTIAENDDYEFNLVNAAVNAIDKKREAQGAPDGHVLVPVEPTPEMIRQGRITPCNADEMDADDDYRAVYKAMIASAQPQHKEG